MHFEHNRDALDKEGVPYAGWVEMTFRLASEGAPTTEVIVPALVMKDSITLPLIGSNVTEQIVDIEMKKSNSTDKGKLNKAVGAVFPGHTKAFVEQVTAVIENVGAEQGHEYVVKTKKNRINIPKHMSVQVECHIQMESPQDISLIIEPGVNLHWAEGLKMCDTFVINPL